MQLSPAEHDPSGDPETDLIRSFALIARAAKSRELGGGMERGAQWLLLVLDRRGALRLNQLASACELDGSTVSRHVRNLEHRSLVSRSPDPDDGRAQLVELTGDGRELVRQIHENRRSLIAERLQTWSRADVSTLTTLMARLADEIEATHEEARKNP